MSTLDDHFHLRADRLVKRCLVFYQDRRNGYTHFRLAQTSIFFFHAYLSVESLIYVRIFTLHEPSLFINRFVVHGINTIPMYYLPERDLFLSPSSI
jgi:hypothetical protein